MIDEIIKILTKKMIEQSMKDKKENRVELISKVGAYKSLINLLKGVRNEQN